MMVSVSDTCLRLALLRVRVLRACHFLHYHLVSEGFESEDSFNESEVRGASRALDIYTAGSTGHEPIVKCQELTSGRLLEELTLMR